MDDNTVSTKLVRYLLSQFGNLLLKQLCLTEMENLLANLPSPDANEASLQLDLQAMQFFNRTFIQLFTQQFSAYQQIKHDDNSLFFDSYKDGTSVIKLKGVGVAFSPLETGPRWVPTPTGPGTGPNLHPWVLLSRALTLSGVRAEVTSSLVEP
uniref:Uncharacterized protein n=1 Tax=Oryza rufipogon TaxID=4529 RepID=A0A0E0NNZ2_ORYRU